ncbi:hypothetical protein [Ferriphaselus sp. R-1]|uniref:hypothetical protein n=1 Tax=Ferriphaselus sp. R-1 TaxID=1485544 RepID=UPI0005572C3D|nr:hypothetical protein [Ferriphaselus sp. R-1]
MAIRHLTLLLLAALALSGCDKLKAMRDGAPDPKVLDAEAVGYACRVSQKVPEACMKENDAHSPSSVLAGWKKADGDIKGGHIDPTMSNVVPVAASAPAAADAEAEGGKDEKTADAKAEEKSGKHEKPAADEKTDPAGKSGAKKTEHDEAPSKPAKSH